MAQRWYYLESGQTGLLIDMAPGADAFPAIRHFGLSLGGPTDAEALHALTPQPLWGARLDQPKPLCVLPGLQSGEFCAAAVAPAGPGTWRFDAAQFDQTAKGARLRLHFQRQDPGRGRLTQIFQAFGDSGVIGARILAEEWQDPILWAAALAIPLPGSITEAITFGGDWAREFAACRQTLGPGGLLLESYRGRPGHDRFPGLILGEAGLGEDRGLGVALTLGWSGNARMRIDELRPGGFVAQLGELMLDGDEAYEIYESPWAYVATRNDGLNGIAEVMQRFVRSRIIPNLARARPRPVHFNTWEAVYFAQNDETLRDLAERAAFVGAERFVLDDGWFKGRDNDRSALGDWSPDPAKYPDGLFPLIEHVRSLGLEFGLWVEPEMVSPDSDLARQHPGWLRREPDGSIVLQRHQAVLDLSIPAVCDHVYDTISGLLATHPIAYLKWDMNRDLTGLDAEGRPGHADYVRALYDLIERVRQAHPAVEIEACASGGGRCDYGLLSLSDRVWVSDSNDALDRLDIQRNASLFLPPEIMGAHVGPAACHITGRRLSLDLRAHVALFGHMGLELDLRSLAQADAERLRAHISNYKTFRAHIHGGAVHRLPFTDPDHSGLVSMGADGTALALVVRTGSAQLGQGTILALPRLNAARYQVRAVPPISPSAEGSLAPGLLGEGTLVSGTALRHRGLSLYLPRPETSLLLHFDARS